MTVKPIRFDPKPALDPSSPTTTHEWYQDRTGAFSAGFWAAGPCVLPVNYQEDEFCVILEGKLTLTDASGETQAYAAGDSFLIPSGFSGLWTNETPVRKFYVVHLPR